MAKLKVSLDVPLTPEQTWAHASDLSGYEQWLSIHEAWRGELPEQLAVGTTLDSVASVKGMRNRVSWKIESYDPPKKLELEGNGKGGVKIGLNLSVKSKGDGSEITIDVNLGGAPLFGPIGSGVARALKGDIENSLKTFVKIYA
ncbi:MULTISPECIES: SRPBCC family protein [unclassified Rhodococcus (in: high G+C Gram-positive bacteria)]|uniref:type II toxin-antitoxin system Rv0910 family toxin n=1 Tax=unclassified Rhodococcus (in: high G+C Gram-positive bacteria) TaxID=192944 RepID=UPI0011ED2EB3|nr:MULTISPECIES: SRPBCC family protein [unclassified Rhodococcus (in: high G+C Gram-positive bacteria)]KAA0927772.1 SRPBCC family protein [Rhodococcus sp. ANT_H53B]MDV7988743.1 SRPBCC family protein [Rhodococcus sp. IEGM 1374]